MAAGLADGRNRPNTRGITTRTWTPALDTRAFLDGVPGPSLRAAAHLAHAVRAAHPPLQLPLFGFNVAGDGTSITGLTACLPILLSMQPLCTASSCTQALVGC